MILDQVQTKSKVLIHMEKVFDLLAQKKPEILVTLGAGNIDTLVSKISKYYSVC
jgi:UDP-N-acetylmuramate--alanine ligase